MQAGILCVSSEQAGSSCLSCVSRDLRQGFCVCRPFPTDYADEVPATPGEEPKQSSVRTSKAGDSSEGAHLVWAGPLPEEAPALAVSRIHIPVATRRGRVKKGCSGAFESFLDFNSDVKF